MPRKDMPKASPEKKPEAGQATEAGQSVETLVNAMKEDHQELRDLLQKVKQSDGSDRDGAMRRLETKWQNHRDLEEDIFTELAEQAQVDEDAIELYCLKHDIVTLILMAVRQSAISAQNKIALIEQSLTRFLDENGQSENGLLEKIRNSGLDLSEAIAQIGERKQQIDAQDSGNTRLRLRYLSFQSGRNGLRQEETAMNNRNMPERDEQGRFVSDDERGRRHYQSRDDDDRRYSSRGRNGRYDDDDRYYSGRGRNGHDNNDDRHYAGRRRDNDDDRRYSSRGRDYDDDRRDTRGHGGWFGDSEGHAEAARRGWDERRDDDRRYSSRRRDDDDDRRYSSRGRDYDDDDRRDNRGHGGWFGDPEGHSQASRRGWENRRD